MSQEFEDTYGVRRFNIRKPGIAEHSMADENRQEAKRAGAFLTASGINGVVTDFASRTFGSMFGRIVIPRNEHYISGVRGNEPVTKAASASLVLRWEDLELRKFIFKVTAGRFETGDKALTATLYEIPHSKKKRNIHDDLQGPYVFTMHLGRNFDFGAKLTKDQRDYYRTWLREKILNVGFFQGEEIIPSSDPLSPTTEEGTIFPETSVNGSSL